MTTSMTIERATEFGQAWNTGNAGIVASFFADDVVYHTAIGPDVLGKSFVGKEAARAGVQSFFDRFPNGKFEDLKVVVSGNYGSFEWKLRVTDAGGRKLVTAGCDLLEFRGDKVVKKAGYVKVKALGLG